MTGFKRGLCKSDDTNTKSAEQEGSVFAVTVKMLGEDFSVSDIEDANGPAQP